MGLNPLKRVNSILTRAIRFASQLGFDIESQSPQAGQFNSYTDSSFEVSDGEAYKVSIPSSGSIQFLLLPLLWKDKD